MSLTRSASSARSINARPAQSRRSSRLSSVTLARRVTSGATSRGTAMSTINSGGDDRSRADCSNSKSISVPPAPVHVSRTSASESSVGRSANGTTRPPMRVASCSARSRGAVGDHDVVGSGVDECGGDSFAHLSGADDQHSPADQRPEPLGCHLDCGVADRRRTPTDRRLGARPLAGLDRMAEQQVERGLCAAFFLGELPCRTHLTEDLALAEHCRIEAGGDLEQVGHGCVVVLAVEVGVQLVGSETGKVAEEVTNVGVGAVEALGDCVDLGAVARAEHDSFADVVPSRPDRQSPCPARRVGWRAVRAAATSLCDG